jgi:hypothetical protein
MTPEVFAPGIVSTAHHEHSRLEFNSSGQEVYWAVIPVEADGAEQERRFRVESQSIWFSKGTLAGWSRPRVLLPTDGGDARSPALSRDGDTLYHISPDPQSDPGTERSRRPSRLFAVARESGGWSDPVAAPGLLPGDGATSMSFCFADSGSLYFDQGGPDESGEWRWEVFVSRSEDGRLGRPEKLGAGINDGSINWCPWVAPDESYLIWSSHREGQKGHGDLYVSFRQAGGEWGRPVPLGDEVNTPAQERFPSVSPDGGFLFFARHTDSETYSDIYWVSSQAVQKLRP